MIQLQLKKINQKRKNEAIKNKRIGNIKNVKVLVFLKIYLFILNMTIIKPRKPKNITTIRISMTTMKLK